MIPNRAAVVGVLAWSVVCAAADSHASSAHQPPAERQAPSAVSIAAQLGVAAGTAQRLQPVLAADGTVSVPMVLDGVPVTLRLAPHDVRAEAFQLFAVGADGIERCVAPPPVRTYRGTVDGLPGAVVAASWRGDGLVATVRTANGAVWQAQPLPAGEPGVHAVYRWSDVLDDGHGCGVAEDVQPDPPSQGGIAGAESCNALCQIAFDADFEYFSANGSSVSATVEDIETVLNAVDLIYGVEVAISYTITSIKVRTAEPDPYTSSDPQALLYELKAAWSVAQPFPFDVVHLMTGRNLNGSVIGIAFLAGVCVEDDHFGLSQSKYTSNFAKRIALTSHELGHNWNASHCNGQLDCGIMCSSIGGCNGILTSFGLIPTLQMTAWRDAAECLSPGPNYAPIAVADEAVALAGVPLVVDVLANDVDINCDPLSISAWDATTAAGGTVELCPGGGNGGRDALLYTPPAGVSGADGFAYTIVAAGESASADVTATFVAPHPADHPLLTAPGIDATYYAYNGTQLPDFATLTPLGTGAVSAINFPATNGPIAGSGLADQVAAQFAGFIEVSATAVYQLFIESDEGSRLFLGEELLINNDGVHAMLEQSALVALEAGKHAIGVDYFERGGVAGLIVRISGGGLPKQPVPPAMWSRALPVGDPDLDGNGVVDGADLGTLLAAWGTSGGASDLDLNGTVGQGDLAVLLAAWGS